MRKTKFAVLVIGFVLARGQTVVANDFAIRDGDTIVFLGDSITAARNYTKTVENYVLLRYPERGVRFINSGWGGDTAHGGLARLDRDVFAHDATVLIVAYGVNDIGWGMLADEEHKQLYLQGIRGIVERSLEQGVRVFIGSAAITAETPDTSETSFLQKICDEGLAEARALGAGTIDIQRGMRNIQRRMVAANEAEPDPAKKISMHAADGIHLNDLGHLAMAFVILKGLGAPAEVSAVAIDVAGQGEVETSGCVVTDTHLSSREVSFTRRDAGLPINFGLFGALNFRFVPFHEAMGRYMLTVRGLDPGRYEILVDERKLGVFSADALSRGVNLCSATADPWQPGGPWEAQAGALQLLTTARNEVEHSEYWVDAYLKRRPDPEKLGRDAQRARDALIDYQRALAKPYAYAFSIQPAPEPPTDE